MECDYDRNQNYFFYFLIVELGKQFTEITKKTLSLILTEKYRNKKMIEIMQKFEDLLTSLLKEPQNLRSIP